MLSILAILALAVAPAPSGPAPAQAAPKLAQPAPARHASAQPVCQAIPLATSIRIGHTATRRPLASGSYAFLATVDACYSSSPIVSCDDKRAVQLHAGQLAKLPHDGSPLVALAAKGEAGQLIACRAVP